MKVKREKVTSLRVEKKMGEQQKVKLENENERDGSEIGQTERKRNGSKSGKSSRQNHHHQRKSKRDMLKISRRRARKLETNFGVDWKRENAPKMENGKARESV